MKVLVTGGAGFIGGYVLEELESRGHYPVIFDHYDRGDYDFPVILGDITDDVAVTEAMAHFDAFIHLAGVLGTQETISNPLPAAFTNIIGGLNMFQAAAQYNIPGVYIGVGNYWMNNTYSISKTTVERFVDMFNRERGTKINVVRAMNAYGPRQRPSPPFGSSRVRKIAPSFTCRALADMDIEVYGDGSQISDMIYVTDVAEALVTAMEKAAKGIVFDKVVEIGPKENKTVQEIAQLVIDLSESNSKIVNLPMRPGEVPGATVKADVSTLELVDMNPKDLVPLSTGMEKTLEYYESLLNNTTS